MIPSCAACPAAQCSYSSAGGGGRRGCYQMVCFLRAKQPDVPCAEKGFKKEVLLERVRAVIIATLAPGAPLPPAV